MVGVAPPEARVIVAPPDPPQTRFCGPVTLPEVLAIATGHTAEPDGALR
jgi:hypothetical protein